MPVLLDYLLSTVLLNTKIQDTIINEKNLENEKMYFIYDKHTGKKYIARRENEMWKHLAQIVGIREKEGAEYEIVETNKAVYLEYPRQNRYIYWEIPVADINRRLNLDKLNYKQAFEASVALHKNKIPPEVGHLIFEYLEGPKTKGPHNIVDDDEEQQNTKSGKPRKSKSVKKSKPTTTRKNKTKNT